MRAGRRTCHSHDEGLSSSQSSPVGHRTGRPVVEQFDSQIPNVRENPRRGSGNEQIRILLERQGELIPADFRAEIQKHGFQAEYDRRRIQKLNRVIQQSQKERNFIVLIMETNDFDEINNFFMNNYWNKIGIFVKLMRESLNEGSTFDTIAMRKLVEDRYTILELTGKIQELQNEINCMNDSRNFQDAESVRSGQSHFASQPLFFPPHPDPCGMLSRSLGLPSRKNGAPSIWDTHGISGNVFANPTASSSAPHPQELNPLSSHMSGPIHSSSAEKNENQTPFQDRRCQPGPSAKNSVILSGGDNSKNYGADQQRLQISDLHFDKFTRQQHSLGGRKDSRLRYVLVHNFLRKRCNASKKWRWLIQWMI